MVAMNGVFPSASRARTDAQVFVRNLYATHAASLLTYVTRILEDPEQSEDVVQETMVRAWRHAERFTRDDRHLDRWLVTVARNLAFDRLRARKVRPTEVDPDEAADQITQDHSPAVVDSVLLEQALTTLSPKHRETLEYVYLAGYTTAETAALLGLPVGTVKTRTHHALRRLRMRLATERPGDTAPRAQDTPVPHQAQLPA
jgi:RNA polymerase sigma-70 factor (ECF subfamily)